MSQFNFPGNSTTVALLAAASCANTAAATGSGVDLLDYEGPVVIVQNHGTGTGTLDGKIQDSADGATDWQDVTGGGFTSVTTTAAIESKVLNRSAIRRYVRYVGTIVTGPQVVGVVAIGVPKSV
jgi:hypothetical protein